MGKAAERSEQSRDQAAPFCLKAVLGYYSFFSRPVFLAHVFQKENLMQY